MFFRDELWGFVRLVWFSGADYVAWPSLVEGAEPAVSRMFGEVAEGREGTGGLVVLMMLDFTLWQWDLESLKERTDPIQNRV